MDEKYPKVELPEYPPKPWSECGCDSLTYCSICGKNKEIILTKKEKQKFANTITEAIHLQKPLYKIGAERGCDAGYRQGWNDATEESVDIINERLKSYIKK